MARNMEIELLTFSLILYQSKNCGHRIHVLFMMCHIYLLILSNEEKRMIMKILKKKMIYMNREEGRRKRNPCPMRLWKRYLNLTNCENNSLREFPLFNLQILLFRVWFLKDIIQCRSVQ